LTPPTNRKPITQATRPVANSAGVLSCEKYEIVRKPMPPTPFSALPARKSPTMAPIGASVPAIFIPVRKYGIAPGIRR
jgi:hypothetical protein